MVAAERPGAWAVAGADHRSTSPLGSDYRDRPGGRPNRPDVPSDAGGAAGARRRCIARKVWAAAAAAARSVAGRSTPGACGPGCGAGPQARGVEPRRHATSPGCRGGAGRAPYAQVSGAVRASTLEGPVQREKGCCCEAARAARRAAPRPRPRAAHPARLAGGRRALSFAAAAAPPVALAPPP